MNSLVIQGTYFSAGTVDQLKIGVNNLVCIDDQGMIERVLTPQERDYQVILQEAKKRGNLLKLGNHQYLLPGFIDLHVHAPQWPQAGLALDLPLEEWLNHYTFPLEAKFKNPAFATKVYHSFVHELLSQGTTAAMMFGTIHNKANMILARQAATQGLRAFIGQVVMDNPAETPTYYRNQSAKAALVATEKFIHTMGDLQATTATDVVPVITPRFVPSCTDEALQGLGDLARKYDLPVQSHLSESNWEHGYAIDRFGMHDTAVMDHFHLLTSRAVMAHGTQLTSDDWQVLRQHQTAIAHCPISNVYFGNAVLPVKRLLGLHNRLGMGSDISGGYSPSIYHNLRQAVQSSQELQDGVDNQLVPADRGVAGSRITMTNAFYLATVGGAAALHLKTGKIVPGYQADFQVVNAHPALVDLGLQDVFQRLMYQTEQSDIESVYVGGSRVYHNE